MSARSLSSFPPQGAVASGGSAAGLPDNLVVDNTTGGTDLDVSTGDSIAGVAELALVSDAGAITIDATGGSVEINSSTGDVSLGNDAVAQSVNVGTGAAAKTTTLGSTNTTSQTTVNSGSGGTDVGSAGAVTVGGSTATSVAVGRSGIKTTITGDISVVEQAASAAPSAGQVAIYAKADGLVYSKDDAGTETLMSGGSGGGGETLAQTLAIGATTGGTNLTVSTGDKITGQTGMTLDTTAGALLVTANGGNFAASAVGGNYAATVTGASGTVPVTQGGQAKLTGGQGGANLAGGSASVTGGAGNGTGAGGDMNAYGGAAGVTGTGNGGAARLQSGAGGGTSGNSGAVVVDAGPVTSGTAGTVSVGTTNAGAVNVGRAGVKTTITGDISVVEQAASATPSAGQVAVYAKADGLVYSKDDAGVETLMSGGSGGGGETLAQTLALGAATGGTNLTVSTGDSILGDTGSNLLIASATPLGAISSGNVSISTGDGSSDPSSGVGDIFLLGGDANAGGQQGGGVAITAGRSNGNSNGGFVSLTSGWGGTTDGTKGGTVSITARPSLATNGSGGDVSIQAANNNGTGADGEVHINTISGGEVHVGGSSSKVQLITGTASVDINTTADTGGDGHLAFGDAVIAEAIAPGTPSAGKVAVYAKVDGLIYSKDDAGTETLMSSGVGVGPFVFWRAESGIAHTANPAAFSSTGNGTGVLLFDDAIEEAIVFLGAAHAGIGAGNLSFVIHWGSSTATTGDVRWSAAIERQNTTLEADSFATAQLATTTVGGTVSITTTTTITFTIAQADSIAAGESFRLLLKRVAADAADTMVGDALVNLVTVAQ